METQSPQLPPPPRLIATLASGFDIVANRIGLILPPLLLDMWLWLGPHLRLYRLLAPVVERTPLFQLPAGPSLAEVAAARQAILEALARFNLFSLLRTFPLGVTSLMFSRQPLETPFGAAPLVESPSVFALLGYIPLLVLTGWCLGSLYFHWISGATLNLKGRSIWKSMGWTILLSLFWSALLLTVGLPALMVLRRFPALNPWLGQGMLFLISLFAVWLALPVFFSPHGIYAEQHNTFLSLLKGWHMVRYTLPSSGLFLALAFIISEGTAYLWRVPAENSWWMLVGIVGHAFITTSLLAASFVYYRDTNLWLQAVLERLRASARSANA